MANMLINTTQIQRLLWPGINSVFQDVDLYDNEWHEIFSSHTSDKAFEIDVEMKMLGLAQFKAEGASVTYGSMQQYYTTSYLHKYYGLGFIITRQAILDNQYKDAFPRAAESLKNSLRQVRNIEGASILNNGFSSNYPIGDGYSLFNTGHPVQGGTVSNTFAVGSGLNEASLEDAIIQIEQFQNAAGLLIKTLPRKLIVPTNLQFTADRLLESKYRTDTASNDISAIYNKKSVPQGYAVNHFLTNPNGWYLLTNNPNGLKYFDREKLTIDMFTDIDTDNVKTRAIMRFSFGVSDFRAIFGTSS